MNRVVQRRGALPSASIVGASHPPGVKRHRRPKIRSSQWPPVPRSRGVTVLSSACRLTSAVSLGLFCRCCLTVPVDNRRPPRHDLRVPTTELEDQAVAVAFSMAWREAGVEPGTGGDRARLHSAGSPCVPFWFAAIADCWQVAVMAESQWTFPSGGRGPGGQRRTRVRTVVSAAT